MTHTFRLGDFQICGLEIYIFDPAHDETPFPGEMAGGVLTVTDLDRAWELLVDASNSADDDKDAPVRDALQRLASRVLRAGRAA